jgi:hypothetical protein
MPTGDEMYILLNSLDLNYKLMMVFSQLTTVLMWVSATEMVLELALFMTFCSAAKRLGGFWLMAWHIPKGFLGLVLAWKMPRSHNVIDAIDWEAISLQKN